jgi:hypothetical protein
VATPPPPPTDEPPPEPAPEETPPGEEAPPTCPRCGSPYAPGQEYCLECGLRLPLARGMVASQVVPALGRTWRRHIRWYPGDWIWPVLFGLIVAVLAGTIAILVANNNDKGSQKTIVATTATTTAAAATTATQPATETTAPATTAPPETTSTAATETTPTTTATTPTQTTPTGPITWPAGKSGWTIVLASVARSAGLSTARSDARKAIGAGLKDVGILNSDNYSSLKGGYYVVFSGVYDTNGEAESNLSTAKATFSGAYAREITP